MEWRHINIEIHESTNKSVEFDVIFEVHMNCNLFFSEISPIWIFLAFWRLLWSRFGNLNIYIHDIFEQE